MTATFTMEAKIPKITDEELVKIQVRVFKADYDQLTVLYGQNGQIGVNAAIRTMVRSNLRQLNAEADRKINEQERKST